MIVGGVMLYKNLSVNEQGVLCMNHYDLKELAEKYGTPLYVMDENRIRENIQRIQGFLKKYFGNHSQILYASKACDFTAIYRICKEEGIGVDVVSTGEIYSAYKAGCDMSQVYFHGNSKTKDEIECAMELKVGCFVVDHIDEVKRIEEIASKRKIIQKVLLRLTPGIDPHTYEAVTTGIVDCKFGSAIETGAAKELLQAVLNCKSIACAGFHCHIGSQVFDSEVFEKSARVMLRFASQMKKEIGFHAKEINLGGGFGVSYLESDQRFDVDKSMEKIHKEIQKICNEFELEMPKILFEPGRSIVADAGLTLYHVNGVKRIPGGQNYVAIDGGMTDNPRYALYKSKYSVVCANKMNEEATFKCTIAGRCCESGDLIAKDVLLCESIQVDDLIAVLTTGAYNYSMASNYNRFAKPAVVMLNEKEARIVVKRETLEDLVRNDCE